MFSPPSPVATSWLLGTVIGSSFGVEPVFPISSSVAIVVVRGISWIGTRSVVVGSEELSCLTDGGRRGRRKLLGWIADVFQFGQILKDFPIQKG